MYPLNNLGRRAWRFSDVPGAWQRCPYKAAVPALGRFYWETVIVLER
jgi:hypothetical protein